MKLIKELSRHCFIDTLKSIVLFTIIFITIGSLVPGVYYKYFDKTEYLSIKYPIDIDEGTYYACDNMILVSAYTAKQNVNAISHNNWMLINDDGTFTKAFVTQREGLFLEADSEPFSVQIKIPCELRPGNYFISGIKEYIILGNTKTYSFITEPFIIKE